MESPAAFGRLTGDCLGMEATSGRERTRPSGARSWERTPQRTIRGRRLRTMGCCGWSQPQARSIQRAVSGRTAGGLRAVEVTNFADFDGDSKGVEMVGLGRRREGVRIRETNLPGYSVRMAYGQACGEPRSFRQFGRQFGRRGDLAWEAARWR